VTGRLPWANVVQVTAGRLLGRASASGAGNVEELQLGVGLAWNGTAIDCTVASPSTEPGSRVISGGEIVWISAYTFTVSAATYVITGTQYTSAEQSVSLGAADVTNDRIDVIAVDDTGTVIAIAGTPAAQPSEPDIDPATQLKLGIVFVAASSSAPTTTVESLYADNAGGPGEWNWTTSGSGFNVNSTNNPHAGTKDIEGTTVAANAYALASKPSGTLDITTYSLLVFYIRSKVTWNNNRSLQIQFRNAGVLVGSPITFKHNTYGFDSSNITTYQQIAIPITAFAIPAATLINQIRFMDAGGSIGFYIDDVSLQTGGSTNVTGGITQAQADARYAQRSNNLSDLTSASTARTNLGAVAKASSSTDNAIARFDGTSGAALQNGAPTVEDDGRLANVTDPSGAQDAATKAYVDALAVNLGKRARVRAATTANITIATALNNADTLDGVTLATGDLVLVKDQSAPAENGVYVVGVSPARFSEFDTYNEHPGSLIAVAEGTANADTLWLCTSNAGGTINSTAIAFSQLTVSAAITQLTGDVTAGPGSGSQAATIANDAVTNAKAANMAQSTIKGRAVSAGTGDPTDLTATQATAILDAVVGDSGSGGTKGLVPAPSAGDAAAAKFLKANGTWSVPSGAGDVAGPASSVDSEIALFDSTTGKLLKRATGTGFVRATSGVASVSKLKRVVGMIIGDGTTVISTGVQGYVSCPVAGTITKVRLLSSDASVTSGSIVIDIWKDTYANYPPTVGDTITASAKPTITTATKSEDSTLTGWTTSVAAGDVFGFNVDSVTSLKRVTLELTVDE
jgi:hypothetical protein